MRNRKHVEVQTAVCLLCSKDCVFVVFRVRTACRDPKDMQDVKGTEVEG